MKIELTDKQAAFLMRALVSNYAENDSDFESNDLTANSPGPEIIGKLVSVGAGSIETYNNARRQRMLKAPLNKEVFMGNGWHSNVDCNKLHKRLTYAFSELSALEQNGGMGFPFDEDMDKRCKQNIKDVIKDILFAFALSADDLK